MPVRRFSAILILVLALLGPTGWSGLPASDASAPVLVVVELFTSEGCSSCPPAESLLSVLEMSQPVEGVEVVALSLHVDYWDGLGWKDPFSSPEFTRRQQGYASRFNNDGLYTPQMVIDGREELVGANRRTAIEAIRRQARQPRASVSLELDSQDAGRRSVGARVRVDDLPAANGPLEVVLAVTESELASDITAGENVGRKLRHTAVVRELRVIGELDSATADGVSFETDLLLDPDWKRDNVRVIVFVQERVGRRIVGSAVSDVRRTDGDRRARTPGGAARGPSSRPR